MTGPYVVLAVLFGLNAVKYVHRQAPYALLPWIQADLHFGDLQAGALASAFMAAYIIAALPLGWFASRGLRRDWIAWPAAVWTTATMSLGACGSLPGLLIGRAATGAAQAGYGSAAPSCVADHFPRHRRGLVLALYSASIPLGSALGYMLPGWLGRIGGWRTALVLVGLPGLLLALLAHRVLSRAPSQAKLSTAHHLQQERPTAPAPSGLPMSSPGTGEWRTTAPAPSGLPMSSPGTGEWRTTAPASPRDYLSLLRIPSFTAGTLAMAMMTFCMGGFSVWMPTFFVRVRGLDLAQAGMLFGGITAGAGLLGILLGGWLSQRLSRSHGRANFLIPAWGMLAGLPLALAAVLIKDLTLSVAALFAAEFLVFLYMGPLNAVLATVTGAGKRPLAFAANIFILHAFGDAISPIVIGGLSDRVGLTLALALALLSLAPAAGLCFWGAGHYDQDTERIRETD